MSARGCDDINRIQWPIFGILTVAAKGRLMLD